MSMAISRSKYTGDPGLFGDIWGAFKGAVGGATRGFLGVPPTVAGPGSVPVGFAAGPSTMRNVRGQCPEGWARRAGSSTMCDPPGGMFTVNPRAMMLGGVPGITRPQPMAMNGSGDLRGYRLNKSDYFLKSGEYVPAGTRYVKIRRRNPANARATSRAISRVKSAKKYAKSLSGISIRDTCRKR